MEKPSVEDLQAILDGPPDDTIGFPDGIARKKSEIPFGHVIVWHECSLYSNQSTAAFGYWNGEKLCIPGTIDYVNLQNELASRLNILWRERLELAEWLTKPKGSAGE
jgi:hypothetical protein